MANGVDHYQDLADLDIQSETQPISNRSKLAWILGGVAAGAVLGGIVWAIGADRLDACAVENCLSGAVKLVSPNSPFTGENLPELIQSFGLGQ